MMRCFLLLIAGLCASCGSTQREIRELLGKEITFPGSLTICGEMQDSCVRQEPLARLLIYYDSLGCNTCRIQSISDWNPVLNEEKNLEGLFAVQFVFTPHILAPGEVAHLLRLEDFTHPVFIDKEGEFYKKNADLLHGIGQVSLLDKNNRIVLVGTPLYNAQLWNLYRQTIALLIANDGILPDS